VFCKGPPILKEKPPALPAGLNIDLKIWKNLACIGSVVPNVAAVVQSCKENGKDWDTWVHSAEPFLTPIPKSFKTEISLF